MDDASSPEILGEKPVGMSVDWGKEVRVQHYDNGLYMKDYLSQSSSSFSNTFESINGWPVSDTKSQNNAFLNLSTLIWRTSFNLDFHDLCSC